MNGRPKIERPFGDNPVLDILHIVYVDYVQGRLTKIEKLNRIMNYTYPKYKRQYINKLINITINSQQWFKRPNGAEVHLIERGVEVYLNMLAAREAEDANRKANWIIALTFLTIVITILGVLLKK